METFRRMLNALGIRNALVLAAIPLITAIVGLVVAPQLVMHNQRASASIPMTTVTGTHASYEVSTFAADFGLAFTGDAAVSAAAQAVNLDRQEVKPMLTAVHPGESTHVLVTFTASSESAAKAGLVAASKSALRSLAEDRLQRAEIELQAANQLRVVH